MACIFVTDDFKMTVPITGVGFNQENPTVDIIYYRRK